MKKTKLPRIVVFAILSLITAVVWAFFDITRALFTKPETKVEESTLSPLNPTLDLETLGSLQNANFFEEGQVVESISLPSQTPVASPEVTSTPTPLESPTPEATTSGETTTP